MHQMKRFDAHGNLIEIVQDDECSKRFWREFENVTVRVHTKESFKALAGMPMPPKGKRFRHKNTCIWCKNEFIGKKGQMFCPYNGLLPHRDQCRNKAHVKNRRIKSQARPPKPCQLCGTPFKSTSTHYKYCRNPCTPELFRRGKLNPPKTYNCAICGAEFKSRMPPKQARYCRNPCDTRLWTKNQRKEIKG